MNTNRLYKNEEHGIWFGVLWGLAEHFDIDPAIVRILYCLFTLTTGMFFGLFLYFIMGLCIPAKEEEDL